MSLESVLREMEGAFDNHVVTKKSDTSWCFEKPGTFNYRCYISFTEGGDIIVTGDLQELILNVYRDGLAWVRGVLKNPVPGKCSYGYVFEKVVPIMKDGFLRPCGETLKEEVDDTLAYDGLPKYAEILVARDKDEEAFPFQPGALSAADRIYDEIDFDDFEPRCVYEIYDEEGVDHEYPSLTTYTDRFYILVEVLRCFINKLDEETVKVD